MEIYLFMNEVTSLNIHAIINSKTTSSWHLKCIQCINNSYIYDDILGDELNWQKHVFDDLMIMQFLADIQRYLLANNFFPLVELMAQEEKFLNFSCMTVVNKSRRYITTQRRREKSLKRISARFFTLSTRPAIKKRKIWETRRTFSTSNLFPFDGGPGKTKNMKNSIFLYTK